MARTRRVRVELDLPDETKKAVKTAVIVYIAVCAGVMFLTFLVAAFLWWFYSTQLDPAKYGL